MHNKMIGIVGGVGSYAGIDLIKGVRPYRSNFRPGPVTRFYVVCTT